MVTDEELLAGIRGGDEAALRELYRRHVGLVFSVASRVVGREAAEDVVQNVFLAVWRKSETFEPSKGSAKAWIARIAKNSALNDRRAGARQPTGAPTTEELPADALDVEEAHWQNHRRTVLRTALEALPDAQRRALALAFLDELPHVEVAARLNAPLGTVKTRIRLGLRGLASALAASLALALVATEAWREHQHGLLEERALSTVTASDIVPIRIPAAPQIPSEAHGSYRARPGSMLAVLTTSHLPVERAGFHYVGWVQHGGVWLSLGVIHSGADGRSVSVVENDFLRGPPDEVRVTLEESEGLRPLGAVVLEWPARPE